MFKMIAKSLWLLLFSVVICCVVYPLVMLAIGQTLFPFQANGSMLTDKDGKPVGSLSIVSVTKPRSSSRGRRPSRRHTMPTSSSSSALAVSTMRAVPASRGTGADRNL